MPSNSIFMKQTNENEKNNSVSEDETVLSKEQTISKSSVKKNVQLEMDQDLLNKFGEVVKEYVQIDNEIRKMLETIKKLKTMKHAKEELILKFMEQTNYNSIDITGGKLIRNKSETKKKLTQDIIEETLKEKLKDTGIVTKIIDDMEQKRETKINVNLKRTHHKTK